ncbi:aspartic peptidase domain-containing protein [Gilbertella persicaria]|uniref:aspartic peptidase domain-containing protein n=1 Tax=Gilbertella persicaria TaxID=101096 RepID=UPI00221FDABE|nr:aspartic peptidase domain-containing protein [Gilbertella persicaria]KAI8097871.1 aspartic peptidase domain-containing protein [Gilbertella persicaria]
MQIIAATIAILASATLVVKAEEGIIRTPIIRNPRLGNPLEEAKKKYQFLNKRSLLEKRDAFNASLYNDQGSQYLIQVGIGTPAQNFTVTLDTGSADLWVPSTDCPQSSCPFYRFDPSKSSTLKQLNAPFGIQYGIGSVNGTYYTDTVTVGGATVQNQQLGLASMTEDIMQPNPSTGGPGSSAPDGYNGTNIQNVEANGILGLGYPGLTQANSQGEGAYNPFVFNLAEQKIINEPIFSIFLNSVSETGWSGEIIFGGIDETKFDGNLTYLPVASLITRSSSGSSSSSQPGYYYWMVYGQGLGVKNSDTGSNPSWRLRELGAFILDTGTTLTYLPTSVATDIVSAFAGERNYAYDRQSGVFIVDCKTAKSPARFELQMSQSSRISNSPLVLSVPASELVIPVDSNSADTASICMFGIAPLNGGGGLGNNLYLVGDSVLRSAYMVFDMGQNRVGLAATKQTGGAVSFGNSTSNASTSTRSTSNADNLSSGVSTQTSAKMTFFALFVTALIMNAF